MLLIVMVKGLLKVDVQPWDQQCTVVVAPPCSILLQDYNLPEDVAQHLVKAYGTRALQVAELVRSGYYDVKPKTMKRLSMKYPYLEAEIVFATHPVERERW